MRMQCEATAKNNFLCVKGRGREGERKRGREREREGGSEREREEIEAHLDCTVRISNTSEGKLIPPLPFWLCSLAAFIF